MEFQRSTKFVFVGATLSLAAVVLIVCYLLTALPDVANQQALIRSTQGVQAALRGEQDKLSGVLLDNAQWREATEHSYGYVDSAWLQSTWGVSTGQGNYNIVFLVDRQGQTLWGNVDGENIGYSFSDYVGGDPKAFLDRVPTGPKSFHIATDLFRVGDTLLVLGAAPIVAEEGASPPAGQAARFLVFGRSFDRRALAEIAEKTVVADLRIMESAPQDDLWSYLPVSDNEGRSLAFAAWHDARPGDVARDKVLLPTIIVLACLIGYTLWLLRMAWHNYDALRRSEAQALHTARKDFLTGLPNRVALEELLTGTGRTADRQLALLLIDLDGFKDVNDSYGHPVGDKLLQVIASTFRSFLGMHEVIARLGGDEFAIAVMGDDAAMRAERIARRLLGILTGEFDLDGRKALVGASIGLASNHDLPQGKEGELLRRADVAMYTAKHNGRNQLCLYTPSLDADRHRKLELATALGKALTDMRGLNVFYQPYFDSATRTLVGVEALVRWTHERFGPVSPQEFVAIAEEFGLIEVLGMFVLERACRDVSRWSGLKVSVNVSPAQFKNPAFVSMVLAVVNASGIERSQVELEVTETYLVEQHERAKAIIDRLNAEGISVALDDFGTGYSSIGYLRQYKFSKLKLDRTMIAGVAHDDSARKLIQASVLLAQGLDLSITAEGVEEEEDAMVLASVGCDYLQGYLLGRPQPADYIDALIADRAVATS